MFAAKIIRVRRYDTRVYSGKHSGEIFLQFSVLEQKYIFFGAVYILVALDYTYVCMWFMVLVIRYSCLEYSCVF